MNNFHKFAQLIPKTNTMAKGKKTCKILKEIRKQIAAENDIKLVVEECTYQGDCLGTCPKCEAEVRYLERELEKRQRMGKAAVFAGMSIGTLLTAAACGSTANASSSDSKCPNSTEVTDNTIHEPLAGDVVAVAPERPQPDTIIEEPLMGIVPMYHDTFSFDSEFYQKYLKEKFVFSGMGNLSILGGKVEYEHIGGKGKLCNTMEDLAEEAVEFKAPHYYGGEEMLLEALAVGLMDVFDVEKIKGDMEVEFSVNTKGEIGDVKIVKGLDKVLDDAVSSAFSKMAWEPGDYKLKEESWRLPLECRCVLKINFPIDVPIMLQGEPPVPIED